MKVVFDSDEIATAIIYYAQFHKKLDIKTKPNGKIGIHLEARSGDMESLTAAFEVNSKL